MAPKQKMNPFLKLALEMGPLAIFFAVNSTLGIFPGTAAFMVATIIALGISYAIARTVPLMPLVTAVFVLVFGGLTLYLEDEAFIKLKPTIVNLMFATILFVGLMTGRMFIKLVLETAMQLADRGWLLLTRAWIVFFVFLAGLNEFIWRNFSTDFWVSFKVFGVMPLTILFTFLLFPIIQRYHIQPADEDTPKSDVDTPSV
jgi:intracellular septation protein